jgi:hypothetical protein
LEEKTLHSPDSVLDIFSVPSVDSLGILITAPIGGSSGLPPVTELGLTLSSVTSIDVSIFADFPAPGIASFAGSLFLLFEKSSTSVFWPGTYTRIQNRQSN